ncbi:MAG: TonB-dependent receptor [Vicinamibacterales bacterium]
MHHGLRASRLRRICTCLGVWLCAPALALAQLQVAVLTGRVIGPQSQALPQARVQLQDSSGRDVRTTVTAADGSFRLDDIAPGSYVIRVEVNGAPVLTTGLVVRGALPVELTLRAGVAVTESIVVRGDAGATTAEHPWSLAGDTVRDVAEPLPSQRVQGALAALPGWMAEDNGLLHVRGVDDGLLYVQDGIPVYARLDRLFGMPPNPSAIASMHVMNGYIPPEFGFKSGGVIDVRTESGIRQAWSGTVDAGLGDLETRHAEGFAAGPLGRRTGLMLTASDERSSRFLDPVALGNSHNQGRSSSLAAQVTYQAPAGLFSGSAQGGRARYDVPHNDIQEEAGQDQRQRTAQAVFSASWQRASSAHTAWQVSAYRRHGTAKLEASALDTPVSADGERRDDRLGLLASLTEQRGAHTIKVGGELSSLTLDERFTFAVTDEDAAEEAGVSEAAIAHDAADPFTFTDRRRPSLMSVYAQDVFQVSNALTANFGLRVDRSTQLVTSTAWSPRLGLAWRVREGTTVRSSFLRLFQPPQAEYLLLASSEAARALSPFVEDDDIGGGTEVPAERQTALDLSLAQDLGRGLSLDASVWRRRATDVDDPNVFFGTTVTVPNSVARQHAAGFEFRLAAAPRRGWSGSLAYSHASVVQFGPVTGGLFLEDEVAAIQDGTRFIPDHDQRHALSSSVSYANAPRRLRASGTFRYQTGTPVGLDQEEVDNLRGRPGSETVDFETGRVKPRAVLDLLASWMVTRGRGTDATVTVWMNNVTDQTYAYNFGNPFSGTHFGAGRRFGVSLRLGFRQQP